jgi:hypothetical protein
LIVLIIPLVDDERMGVNSGGIGKYCFKLVVIDDKVIRDERETSAGLQAG